MPIRRLRLSAALVAAVVGAGLLPTAPVVADTTSGGRYVALGDSYSADSGVLPLDRGAVPWCLQSAQNYPKLVAAALGLDLTDVTCGGATVQHMTKAQYPGVPAQFDALDGTESVVTLGIGGNDNNLFASALALCGSFFLLAALDLGAPCQQTYRGYFDKRIDSDAANLGAALRGIHERSPQAQIYLVGYPALLPASGRCYPQIPLTTGDTAYMHGVQAHLDEVMREQASLNGAHFVDLAGPSVGHDACQKPGVRWIEPPVSPQPMHPGPLGVAAQAALVQAAINRIQP